MRLKQIYLNIKERIKNYFGMRDSLNKEQRDYVLSGISQDLFDKYKIFFSPGYLFFKKDAEGTKIGNSLEKKLIHYKPELPEQNLRKEDFLSYLTNLKQEIRNIHKKNMEILKLNHLRTMNKIYSSIVETYNKGMDKLKDILIENKRDGSLRVIFI